MTKIHHNKGRKQSQEHILKRVAARFKNGTYKHSAESRIKMSKHRKGKMVGADHFAWKGESVGYFSLHSWVRRHFVVPKSCEECGTNYSPQFNWAMKHGTRSRNRTDWIYLCRKCHIRYDGTWLKRSRSLTGQFI